LITPPLPSASILAVSARNVYRKNRWIDTRKAGRRDGKAAIVVVLSGVETSIQNFSDTIYKRATERYIDRLIGTNANFKIRDVLIHHNIKVATIVVGKEYPISGWVTIGCKTALRFDVENGSKKQEGKKYFGEANFRVHCCAVS
jgi:hypothetical protein